MPHAAKGGAAGASALSSFFFSEDLRKKLKALSYQVLNLTAIQIE